MDRALEPERELNLAIGLCFRRCHSEKGACCAGQDIHDARRVAETLAIPHYVLDYEERFRRAVMDDFAESYARGETPIPCVRCNERVKFGDLLELAGELGADALATGHYVRRVEGAGGPELHAAADAARDQSHFLFATTREQLNALRFPLGAMEKNEVRAVAAELGLSVAAKPDSQDICFVPDGRYADIVMKLRPGAAEPAMFSANIPGSSISPSARERVSASRAMKSRFSSLRSMPVRSVWSWARAMPFACGR